LRLALITLLLALAIPASAEANLNGTRSVSEGLRVAQSYWHTSPQGCASVAVDWRKGVYPRHEYGWARMPQPGQPECRIWLNKRSVSKRYMLQVDRPFTICNIIVHEYGHLLGYDHDYTRDRFQVMQRDPNLSGGPCWHLTPH